MVDVFDAVFTVSGNVLTAGFECALVDFADVGRALESTAFDALPVEPEVFATTGFAGVEPFGAALVFSLETAAPFDFADTSAFAGLTGAGTF